MGNLDEMIRRAGASIRDDVVLFLQDRDHMPQAEFDRWWRGLSQYQRRVARLVVDPASQPHGKESTYTNHGCRCDPCTVAFSDARADRRRDKREADAAARRRVSATPHRVSTQRDEQIVHGMDGYRRGCKCPVCWDAGKAWADNFKATHGLTDTNPDDVI